MLGESLHHALRAFGYVEGQNLILERRIAEGPFGRYGDIIRRPCPEPLASPIWVQMKIGKVHQDRVREPWRRWRA